MPKLDSDMNNHFTTEEQRLLQNASLKRLWCQVKLESHIFICW